MILAIVSLAILAVILGFAIGRNVGYTEGILKASKADDIEVVFNFGVGELRIEAHNRKAQTFSETLEGIQKK